MAAGTYSSIFIATPLLAMWKEKEPEWERMQRRAMRRMGGDAPVAAVLAEAAAEQVDAGAVPRPPRQRRKRR